MANLQTRYSGLKDSKINTLLPNNNHSQKISHFHKYLRKATGAKISELQVNVYVSLFETFVWERVHNVIILQCVAINTKEFSSVQFLQELAQEQMFEITYVDIEEKSVTGKYQCLVQISTLPIAVCFGTGNTPKEAQVAGALNALEYLKLMTRKWNLRKTASGVGNWICHIVLLRRPFFNPAGGAKRIV